MNDIDRHFNIHIALFLKRLSFGIFNSYAFQRLFPHNKAESLFKVGIKLMLTIQGIVTRAFRRISRVKVNLNSIPVEFFLYEGRYLLSFRSPTTCPLPFEPAINSTHQ